MPARTVTTPGSLLATRSRRTRASARYRTGRRGGFIGSPDFMRENLTRYEDAHLDAMIFILHCGDRNLDSVEKSVEAFLELLRRQPDFLTAGPFRGNNRRAFPQFGVTLKGTGTPASEAVFERRSFSNPEAITFFEYVSDCLVAAKM